MFELIELLCDDLSPELISMWLARRGSKLSFQTIYFHIHLDRERGGKLWQLLRHHGKRERFHPFRKAQRGRRASARPQRQGREIGRCLPSVANRRFYGDWEMDLMEGRGRKGPMLVLHERKTRFVAAAFLPDSRSHQVVRRLPKLLAGVRVRTITTDNGSEFAYADSSERATGCKLFFAEPYKPEQKGAVENTNGLLRQHFPKGTDFSSYTSAGLAFALERHNSRPRKCLGGKSPDELIERLSLSR
ncbi:MAG: IS30 family transposase [Verrucomicrobiales bacterium]